MVLSELTYGLDYGFKSYLFNKKYGVLSFINELLQGFNGKIFRFALIICSNIAGEKYSRDLLTETNFIARVRDAFKEMEESKNYDIEILLEMIRALKGYSCKKLSTTEIDIWLDIIKRWVYQGDGVKINDEELLSDALLLIAEITNETDIAEEASEKGITFQLICLLRFNEEQKDFRVVFNCIMALGGLSSTDKIEPINEMLSDGILDNLIQIADTEDCESLEKIYWIWSNITSSGPNCASTFFWSDIFISIIIGLWEGHFEQHLWVVNEAILWVVNTYDQLDDESKMELILKIIDDEDEYHKNPINKLFEAMVEGLRNNLSVETTIYILQMIKSIFEFWDTHTPGNYIGNFKEDVHANFVSSGGPETIEELMNNENVDVNKLAYDIANKWLLDEMEQVYEFASTEINGINF
jgi:hypothetical protein